MESFILFRGSKRVTVKEDDMTTEKIGRIFQVHGPSLYITDDSNVAIFPVPDGHFSTLDLIVRGHYEVHGESISVEDSSTCSVPVTHNPTRFSFHCPPSTAAGSAARASANPRATLAKTFQRNIFIAELVDGNLETSKTLTVRFSEFEASVMGILSKVNDALEEEDSRILTDSQENKILEPEKLLRDAFACIVCKSPVVEPMVSSCCQSLVGCRSCIEEWQKNVAFCPKCRADGFDDNIQRLNGLSDALAALGSILWE